MGNGQSIQDLKADMERDASKLKRQLEEIAALKASLVTPAATGIDAATLEAILARTTKAATAGSELLASKMKPENADHRHLGPFNYPEGGIERPNPTLKRECWQGGFMLRADALTPYEIEALNVLSDTLARGQTRLAHDGKWKAIVSDDDRTLVIHHPMKTMDDRADLPALLTIVTELARGEKVATPDDILAELAFVKSELARLQGAAA
jgi:hypothetical protein